MKIDYTSLTDQELLNRLTSRDDREAFETLYCRYSSRIFDYVYARVHDRYVAQEIIQELFVDLWQKRAQLDVLACRAYLYSAAKNLIITHFRKEIARERREMNWELARVQQEEQTYQTTLAWDLQVRYEQGLKLLPEKCQQVFILSREGLSNREVASRMAISEKTVEQHITKALRFLKGFLREYIALLLPFLSEVS